MTGAATLAVPEMWQEWQRFQREYPEPAPDLESERKTEPERSRLLEQMSAVEHRMVETPARMIDDLLVKLRLADALIKMLSCRIAEGEHIEDRLLISALGDLERLDNRLSAGAG